MKDAVAVVASRVRFEEKHLFEALLTAFDPARVSV